MFDNIGKKIKTLATVVCWIGIISSIGGGLTLFVLSDGRSGLLIFLGLAVMAVGSLLSWVGSFFVYGFGQLIDDTQAMREKIAPEEDESAARNYSESRKSAGQSYTEKQTYNAPDEEQKEDAEADRKYLIILGVSLVAFIVVLLIIGMFM